MVDHLIETDFDKLFPAAVDEFPSPVNDDNYIDAWLLNSVFSSLTEIETYILLYKDTIEAPLGEDVLGDEGSLVVDIPAARYPAGKITQARDTNLIGSNIVSGVSIFGVDGSYEAGGTGGFNDAVTLDLIEEAPVSIDPPSGIMSNNMLTQKSVTATSP